MTPAEIRARFREVVARGIERSDREHAEHLRRLAVDRDRGGRARSRDTIGALTRPSRRRPGATIDDPEAEDEDEDSCCVLH